MTPLAYPKCTADLSGAEIPADLRNPFYGTTETHYSRVIGIYDRDRDRTTHWRCPDCGHEWRRE